MLACQAPQNKAYAPSVVARSRKSKDCVTFFGRNPVKRPRRAERYAKGLWQGRKSRLKGGLQARLPAPLNDALFRSGNYHRLPGGHHGLRGALPKRAKEPERLFPDRKSTRLNSSHLGISYAVFCL